jgi:hypothetical protein
VFNVNAWDFHKELGQKCTWIVYHNVGSKAHSFPIRRRDCSDRCLHGCMFFHCISCNIPLIFPQEKRLYVSDPKALHHIVVKVSKTQNILTSVAVVADVGWVHCTGPTCLRNTRCQHRVSAFAQYATQILLIDGCTQLKQVGLWRRPSVDSW